MTNIGAIFSSVKYAPTQKPVHLLICIAIQILDEGNNHSLPALYSISISVLQTPISPCHKYWIPALYLIGINTLQKLFSPCHKYWITDLEKTENINILTEISLRRRRNFCKLSTFSQYQTEINTTLPIFVAHSWISKIKHYVPLTFIKSKIK